MKIYHKNKLDSTTPPIADAVITIARLVQPNHIFIHVTDQIDLKSLNKSESIIGTPMAKDHWIEKIKESNGCIFSRTNLLYRLKHCRNFEMIWNQVEKQYPNLEFDMIEIKNGTIYFVAEK
jgi:hypothetical protein